MNRIYFKLDPTEWHGLQTESLWGEPVAELKEGSAFVVRNSPFYTREVSYLDIVLVSYNFQSSRQEFARRVDGEGHSTYRLIVAKESIKFDKYWAEIEKAGCSYESGVFERFSLYSVDVPSKADIYQVYDLLERGRNDGVWTFEEGHVGHKVHL